MTRSLLSRLLLVSWITLGLGCGSSSTETPATPGEDTGTAGETDEDTGTPDEDTGTPTDDGTDTGTPPPKDAPTGTLDPPAGGSSGGSGGGPADGVVKKTPGGITYRLIAPSGSGKQPLMIVFSGTEGGATMTANLKGASGATGTGSFIFAVLDGPTYYGKGEPGVEVLDDVRKMYDIDNDRTYLLGESAGTRSALQLGFQLRQSYLAAYWANDVNANGKPGKTAAELGFAPYGNAGPGGDFADAKIIVDGMKAAGYQTPPPAPYDGPGAGTHGAPQQFVAALKWFPGKSRK